MKSKPIISFVIGVIIGIALPIGAISLSPNIELRFRHAELKKERAYGSIGLRMTRNQVDQLMGAAGKISDHFALPQLPGHEFEYANAGRCGAKYFVSWPGGIDWEFVVGFDADDRVVFKAEGGT